MTETDPPTILGKPMSTVEPGDLAEIWRADFGHLSVVLARYKEGRFSERIGAWQIDVGDHEEWFVRRGDAVAAIERELLAIRSTIPEPKPTGGPRHCLAYGGYGFDSDCVACAESGDLAAAIAAQLKTPEGQAAVAKAQGGLDEARRAPWPRLRCSVKTTRCCRCNNWYCGACYKRCPFCPRLVKP